MLLTDMEEPLEDIEEHEPIMKPRDDSYVDELDWDYGTDEGEEDDQCDQHEGNITVIEMAGEYFTVNLLIDDLNP